MSFGNTNLYGKDCRSPHRAEQTAAKKNSKRECSEKKNEEKGTERIRSILQERNWKK